MALSVDLPRIFAGRELRTILDVGANFGQTAERFHRIFPKASIHSFEPITTTFNALVANTKSLTNVHCHKIAIGDRDGSATMVLFEDSAWNKISVGGEPTSGRNEIVPLKTLDTFCSEQHIERIDLLKTDCEGFDFEVLLGAEKLFQSGRIGAIYCEIELLRSQAHADFFAIENFLRDRGYLFYGFYDYSPWNEHLPTKAYANALFVPVSFWPESS